VAYPRAVFRQALASVAAVWAIAYVPHARIEIVCLEMEVMRLCTSRRQLDFFCQFLHFLVPNVQRRLLSLGMVLVGEAVIGDDDWLWRLLEEVEVVDIERARLSARISSRLTLFSWSKTRVSSSRCSVNFETTIANNL